MTPHDNPTPAVCRRCGLCCLKGGPALHTQDATLVASGVITRRDLVTLRKGEPVRENVAGKLAGLTEEMVSIRGGGSGDPDRPFACIFHDAEKQACRIHGHSPAECRALFCEDTSALEAMYREGRLTRADLIDTGGGLWELISFHEESFPAAAAVRLARSAATGDSRAAGLLQELAAAEDNFRRLFLERTAAPPEELDFYFGRALAVVCAPFGVDLTKPAKR
ncbi:YkgJ family cysteine cluster protein [Fundidesulfovibrio terrae]|uniref:YkgJ family cysteine cluster protein n=1 Tax=Fundidesulfovibrio terrae TaxID=2922866 RepID=UPI001FAF784D|nr:YkgJ family cysteine cluster protein [Fundidesulfovibrio terrae]